VPDCLSQHLEAVRACTNALSEAIDGRTVAAERAAVAAAGGRYLDVAPWICTSERCAMIVGNLLVFSDDNHVTTGFARWVTPVFTAAVRETARTR
jgi:hypothetical protein